MMNKYSYRRNGQRMIRSWSVCILAFTMAIGGVAQQDPMYTMYMWNTMSVNSGYAGSADLMSISALSRHQWTGLQGAPSTQTFVLHTPLKEESLGLGISAVHDKIGPTVNTQVSGDFAYRIHTTRRARLAFGLKAGISSVRASLADVENTDPTDPNFQQNFSSVLMPNFGFGLFYWSKMGYAGISVPKLMEQHAMTYANSAADNMFGRERRHVFVIAGYVFPINRDVKFRPSVLIKATEGAPLSFDLSCNFLFVEKLWLGAAFREGDSFSAILSYQITDQLRAGYAFDLTTSALRSHNSGSHEFMLSYDLIFSRERVRSPRYF